MMSKVSADGSIYALLFLENVVSLGFCPWTLLGDFRPSDPLTCPPLEKILLVNH